jgi:hypothetical protein
MASTTMSKASRLATEDVTVNGDTHEAVKNFAILIDTHRDQPHVGMFAEDIHRGECKPTLVHLLGPAAIGRLAATGRLGSGPTIPAGRGSHPDWWLWHATTGQTMALHDKHRFVSVNWWTNYLANYIAEYGLLPIDDKGFMPTKYLRDPRAKRYQLRSFRQIVVERN